MARIINKDNWQEVRDDLYARRREYDQNKSRSTGHFYEDYEPDPNGGWRKKVISPDQFGTTE